MKVSKIYATVLYRDLSVLKQTILQKGDVQKLLDRIKTETPCKVIREIDFYKQLRVLKNLCTDVTKKKAVREATKIIDEMIEQIKPEVLFFVTPNTKADIKNLDLRIQLKLLSKTSEEDRNLLQQVKEESEEADENEWKEEEKESNAFDVLKTLQTINSDDVSTWTSIQKLTFLRKTQYLEKEKVVEEDFIKEGVEKFDKYKVEDFDYTFEKGAHYKILKMPIYAQTYPFMTKDNLIKLGVKGTQVLCGWILENQVCVGVKNRYDLDVEVANACAELSRKTGFNWYNASYDSEWVTKGINGITWAWLIPVKWQKHLGNIGAVECQHAFKFFNRNGDIVDLKRRREELENKIDEKLSPLYEKAEKYEEKMNKYFDLLQNVQDTEELEEEIARLQFDKNRCYNVKDRLKYCQTIQEKQNIIDGIKQQAEEWDEKYKHYRLKLHRTNKDIELKTTEMKAEALEKFRKEGGEMK